VKVFLETNITVCVGTDSLASNHELSILSELLTLKKHFDFLEWDTLLQWATLNGAKALNMEGRIGSIEVGKVPGIVNVQGINTLDRIDVHRVI
jgi:cytosine/adenosine deaminase-related metal-dependent hydrolase